MIKIWIQVIMSKSCYAFLYNIKKSKSVKAMAFKKFEEFDYFSIRKILSKP